LGQCDPQIPAAPIYTDSDRFRWDCPDCTDSWL